ncbi:MAG: type I methionyl aminopeptidase [Dehalococcoidia bacterium]|nr:type I methionyl aminopeptidase [Dehalococcoidia bacterium]
MIIVKSAEEISKMRRAGKIVAIVLEKLRKEVRPGIMTRELDAIAEAEAKRLGAKASFKGSRGFPASICTSVNDEVVHGIPGPRILKEGDIVSIDFGAIVDGFHGDAGITVPVGEVTKEARRLIETAEGALAAGIRAAHGGCHIGDISAAIQEYVESRGFSVVREYTGHGIGRDMHEDPLVPNFGTRGQGPRLPSGTTIALEPMVNAGTWQTRLASDQWTVKTSDGSLSAYAEHTILLTDNGAEVLTAL